MGKEPNMTGTIQSGDFDPVTGKGWSIDKNGGAVFYGRMLDKDSAGRDAFRAEAEKISQSARDARATDAAPRTLYVHRPVLNGAEIQAWAKEQGFKTTLQPDDMHVTIMYSQKAVDWMKMGAPWQSELDIPKGGPRLMEKFGEAVVLLFTNHDLQWRNEDMVWNGAKHSHTPYTPHVTITYDLGDVDLDKIEPFQGEIKLGPEKFEELDDDYRESLHEDRARFLSDLAGTKIIGDGSMVAEANVARTGIQIYLAKEVGIKDHKNADGSEKTVKVYRPADEVFATDSLRTYSHATVTIDHPPLGVTPDNYKDLSVGEASTAVTKKTNGVLDVINIPLILKDRAAIELVQAGTRELSVGYDCKLDFTPGTTADGETYDAVQRDIRVNHIAIVERGRAGHLCKIGDSVSPAPWGATPIIDTSNQEDDTMSGSLTNVVVGDKVVAANDAAAPVIEDLKAQLAAADQALVDAKKKAGEDEEKLKEEISKKDGEIEVLKADAADAAKLDDAVTAKLAKADEARSVLGDSYEWTGKDTETIDKEILAGMSKALSDKRGEDFVKDRDAAFIRGAYEATFDTADVGGGAASGDPIRSAIATGDGVKKTTVADAAAGFRARQAGQKEAQ